ncbi:MAG: phage tail protein, partial [Bacteroidales bacterium]|nr:phage tail protein [Bacteroidales bacterium]
MAQPYNGAVITYDGLALLTRAQAGDCHIVFTRMAIGDGKPDDPANATSLQSERASYPIRSISYHSDTCVKIRALISNWDTENEEPIITEGFYMNEIGLFAEGSDTGDEILYSIATTSGEQGDYMPAYDYTNPIMIQQDYYA